MALGTLISPGLLFLFSGMRTQVEGGSTWGGLLLAGAPGPLVGSLELGPSPFRAHTTGLAGEGLPSSGFRQGVGVKQQMWAVSKAPPRLHQLVDTRPGTHSRPPPPAPAPAE